MLPAAPIRNYVKSMWSISWHDIETWFKCFAYIQMSLMQVLIMWYHPILLGDTLALLQRSCLVVYLTMCIHTMLLFKLIYIKGIWYGSDPVVISLQLTNFQSLIGQSMNHAGFKEDPKSYLPVSRTCTFFKYTITANGKNDISGEKIHFL